MNQGTISVNTSDWLRATRDMRISAFIEAPAAAISQEESSFTKQAFEEALKKVSRRRKPEKKRS